MAQRLPAPRRLPPVATWTLQKQLQPRVQQQPHQPGRYPTLNIQHPALPEQPRADTPRPDTSAHIDQDPMHEYNNTMIKYSLPSPQQERIYPIISDNRPGVKVIQPIQRPESNVLDIHQSESQPLIKINKEYIFAAPDRHYWFNCLRCNPRPKCPGNIVPEWEFTHTQEDPYMNVPYLTLKSTPEGPRSPYFPYYFGRPPNSHAIMAGDLQISLAQICVNLLGIDFHININNFNAMGYQYHFSRILQFLQCDMLDMGIYATPLELAFQTISGNHVHFAPLHDSFMQHDSPVVGTFCHKFIVPMRVTSYRRWTMPQIAKYELWKTAQLRRLALFPQDRAVDPDPVPLFSLGRRGLPETSLYDFQNCDDTRYDPPYHDIEHPLAFVVLPRWLPQKKNSEGQVQHTWTQRPRSQAPPSNKYYTYTDNLAAEYPSQQPPQLPYHCAPTSPAAWRVDDTAYDRLLQDRLTMGDFNAFSFPAFLPTIASAPPPLQGQAELERSSTE